MLTRVAAYWAALSSLPPPSLAVFSAEPVRAMRLDVQEAGSGSVPRPRIKTMGPYFGGESIVEGCTAFKIFFSELFILF